MNTDQQIRLTSLASCAGCAAKMGPQDLARVLHPLKQQDPAAIPPNLLIGLNAIDDAAVYRVNEQQAIISTADFFPPVV
ncbi:MAG: selenide, water dikinase SelD, partial [Ktedonobacteraceae bacterium]|nr:selenide, water dikinase SelD [Ktedonobacteraceae bacterium]